MLKKFLHINFDNIVLIQIFFIGLVFTDCKILKKFFCIFSLRS